MEGYASTLLDLVFHKSDPGQKNLVDAFKPDSTPSFFPFHGIQTVLIAQETITKTQPKHTHQSTNQALPVL